MSDTATRATRGARWLYAFRWIERLLDFGSLLLLARLLTPEDFGLVAIAGSFVAILQGLSDFDVHKALLRSRSEERGLFDTAWTLGALRGGLAALVLLGLSTLPSDPRLGPALAVLALAPLFAGLNNPRFVLYERALDYSKVAVQTLGAKLLAVVVMLAVAFVTRSFWALILGTVVGSLATLVMSYALRPYRPRLALSHAREIFGFSGWMSLTTIVTTLSMETDKLIVGRYVGVVQAGVYFMTMRIGVLPTRELVSPLQRLLFPSFSEIAGDRERLRRVVLESTGVLASLSLPAGVGFALVASDLVPLALGDQWLAITPLLCVLVPYLGLRATLSNALPCAMALGETRLLLRASIAYALIHLPAFVLGTLLFDVEGAVWSVVLAGLFYSYLNLWLLERTVQLGPLALLRQLQRPLLATAAMALTLFALEPLAPFRLSLHSAPDGASWPGLLSKSALGAAVYTLTLVGLWRLQGRPAGFERRLLLQVRSH